MDWSQVETPYIFHDPVPNGTYRAKVIVQQRDETHTPFPGVAMALRIQTGEHTGTLVYDWWYDDPDGYARLKVVATTLGYALTTQEFPALMEFMLDRIYDVTVYEYITTRGQRCSRVAFDGYALP